MRAGLPRAAALEIIVNKYFMGQGPVGVLCDPVTKIMARKAGQKLGGIFVLTSDI